MIGGAISLEGLGLQVVEDVQEADFILAHGTEAIGLRSGVALPMKLEDLEKILKRLQILIFQVYSIVHKKLLVLMSYWRTVRLLRSARRVFPEKWGVLQRKLLLLSW